MGDGVIGGREGTEQKVCQGIAGVRVGPNILSLHILLGESAIEVEAWRTAAVAETALRVLLVVAKNVALEAKTDVVSFDGLVAISFSEPRVLVLT